MDKLRGYPPSSILLLHGEHGNVSTKGAAPVSLELRNYNADELVPFILGLNEDLESLDALAKYHTCVVLP